MIVYLTSAIIADYFGGAVSGSFGYTPPTSSPNYLHCKVIDSQSKSLHHEKLTYKRGISLIPLIFPVLIVNRNDVNI
jgi:hypothetical protein